MMTSVLTRNEEGITFAVHDVQPAVAPLNIRPAHEGINNLLKANECEENAGIFTCSGYNSRLVAGVTYHPLIACVHLAFSEHRPIVFSPDMIWIAIMQGLAQHVKLHAERLRPKLVAHQGKQELAIAAQFDPGSPESAWDSLISDFSAALKLQIGAQRHGQLVSDFSTTGDLERIVCEISLMDIYKPFYEYVVYCICGIPSVTLEGTPADWLKLRQKVEILGEFEMDFWLPHLRTILDQFERASRGDIDLKHWRNIYKIKQAYGWHRMNGWIGRLVPYVKESVSGDFSIVNPLFELDYLMEEPAESEETVQASHPFAFVPGMTSADLPSGLSIVPVNLVSESTAQPVQFIGGFVGVEQEESLRLRPRLGWAVRKSPESDNLIESLKGAAIIKPLTREAIESKTREIHAGARSFAGPSIPGDFSRFYGHCDGLNLDPQIGKFRSFADLEVVPQYSSTCEKQHWELTLDEQAAANEKYSAIKSRAEDVKDLMTEWLRFFDFPDGRFLAFPLAKLSSGPQAVKIFSEPWIGQTFAVDFKEAVMRLRYADGVKRTAGE